MQGSQSQNSKLTKRAVTSTFEVQQEFKFEVIRSEQSAAQVTTVERNPQEAEKLLSAQIIFPQTPSMQNIRREWFENPHATIILDFEYHSELPGVMKDAVFTQ